MLRLLLLSALTLNASDPEWSKILKPTSGWQVTEAVIPAGKSLIIPKDSNSGIYLQGRYEIQILDSAEAGPGDIDDIYHRWDDKRKPKGSEGHSPKKQLDQARR